jgi:hypothetical protein
MEKDAEEFFRELSNGVEQEYDDICPISKIKLDETRTKLSCGHEFNYMNIYAECVAQKQSKTVSLQVTEIKVGELRCPYCRNIQKGILPYIKMEEVKKIKGVNYPPSMYMRTSECNHIMKSGKRKNLKCDKACSQKYCYAHIVKYMCLK